MFKPPGLGYFVVAAQAKTVANLRQVYEVNVRMLIIMLFLIVKIGDQSNFL